MTRIGIEQFTAKFIIKLAIASFLRITIYSNLLILNHKRLYSQCSGNQYNSVKNSCDFVKGSGLTRSQYPNMMMLITIMDTFTIDVCYKNANHTKHLD